MPTALLSVWDKTGLGAFAAALQASGWDLVASGGTAKALVNEKLRVVEVSELTGEPEMLGGRVKTLHPAVHAGLLARATPADQAALAERGWAAIDMVVVNLYPFEQAVVRPDATPEEIIEMIDIGGVALLRAAAKNYQRVTVLCDPADYDAALNTEDPAAFRLRMARKAFARTSAYDSAIQAHFTSLLEEPAPLTMTVYPTHPLRYGENPHQEAVFCPSEPDGTPFGGRLLQGKALSYNNLLDLDAAWRAAQSFADPAVVVVKHLSPCGLASASTVAEALPAAIASDPVSAFGSVIAANRPIDEAFAHNLGDLFVECLIAPGFTPQAMQAFAGQKNLRLIEAPLESAQPGGGGRPVEYRSVGGGLLRQDIDLGDPDAADWRVVTERQPTEAEWDSLRFAWQAVQPVKSNAIVFAAGEGRLQATVGIGGGQPNRVDCVRIAAERAGAKAPGAVMASDAFFPFPDGLEAAARAGITAVIQPGGSIRDEQVIAAADEAGMAMVLTGVRHFRH